MHGILITGAASGIGAASARLFHARGWRVGLLDMNAEALAGLAAELGGAWQRALDVTDAAAVRAAVADFVGAGDGRLRLLFNCAGILRFGRFEEIPAQDHARLLAINVQGLLNCCHAAFEHLKATPGAQVLNMGSASGLYGANCPLAVSWPSTWPATRASPGASSITSREILPAPSDSRNSPAWTGST